MSAQLQVADYSGRHQLHPASVIKFTQFVALRAKTTCHHSLTLCLSQKSPAITPAVSHRQARECIHEHFGSQQLGNTDHILKDGSFSCCSVTAHSFFATSVSCACDDGCVIWQSCKYAPEWPFSSGATAAYTDVAAPCSKHHADVQCTMETYYSDLWSLVAWHRRHGTADTKSNIALTCKAGWDRTYRLRSKP